MREGFEGKGGGSGERLPGFRKFVGGACLVSTQGRAPERQEGRGMGVRLWARKR